MFQSTQECIYQEEGENEKWCVLLHSMSKQPGELQVSQGLGWQLADQKMKL